MIVLDSSALLAVLLEEKGAQKVKATFNEAVISTATLTEVLSKVEQRGLDSEYSYNLIQDFGIGIAPVEALHARVAAKIALAPKKLDLSLGDRLCIALAIQLQCPLMTSDGGMAKFDAGVPVKSFR